MPEFPQRRSDGLVETGLELQHIGGLIMMEARRVAGGLHVGAEVEQVDQHLHVSLRLLGGAHETKRHERQAVLHDESRQQRVKWPFPGCDAIGTVRIQ